MKRGLTILSLAALIAFALGVQVEAGCGACGDHPPAVKKACPADCSKPCCAAPVAKKACCGTCQGKKDRCGTCEGKKECKKSSGCTRDAVKKASVGSCTASTCGTKAPKMACGPDCTKPCCAAKVAVAEINTSGLKALIDAGAKLTILDARSGKYDDGRRIPGAKSLAAGASEKEASKVVRSKKSLVVTYCSNLKCPASEMLAENLKKQGYTNVIEYRHGIEGWAAAGLPVEKAKK